MENRKSRILWILISLILAGLCIWGVLRGVGDMSLSDLIAEYRKANPGYMLIAALCMFGFILFEGLSIRSLLVSVGHKKQAKGHLLYASADVFFSAITPSASGGQPASAFFMMHDGVTGAVSTVVLLVNLVMYTLAVCTAGVIAFAISPTTVLQFSNASKLLIVIGVLIVSGLMVVFLLILRKGNIIFDVGKKIIAFLHRIKLMKHPEKRYEKLEKAREDYKQCVRVMAGKKRALVQAYFYNVLSRLSLTTVPVFVYLATGGTWANTARIWSTQCWVAIGSNCAPIPGAMGVADYLMLDGLSVILDPESTVKLELLSRGVAFYCCVALAGLIMAIGYGLRFRKKKIS